MSDEDADQQRAKRRRCAPRRYDDEDHGAMAKETAVKCSPVDSSSRQQQETCSDDLLLSHYSTRKPEVPQETQDDQALRVIHQLAAKLGRHKRPHLGVLFGLSDGAIKGPAPSRCVSSLECCTCGIRQHSCRTARNSDNAILSCIYALQGPLAFEH